MGLASTRNILIFLLCAFSYKANSEALHYLEIGINIGYLSNACKHKDLLEKTVNDGIYLYAVRDVFSASSTQDDKLQCISDILALHPNVRLTIELSDFPKDGESLQELYDKYQNNLPFNYETVKTIYSYSNRFPPSDIGLYGERLRVLLLTFEEAHLINRISFQVGSEPDAPLYFFGDAEDYRRVLKVSTDVLQEFYQSHEVLCCGMTASYIVNPNERQSEFKRMFETAEVWKNNMTFSHSLFFYNSQGFMDFNGLNDKELENAIISSWNTFSYSNRKSICSLNNMTDNLYYFGELLRFAYKNKISKAFYWTLMDYTETSYLGLFNFKKGQKIIYSTFLEIAELARSGYTIVPTEVGYDIKGKALHIGIDKTAINDFVR